nr:protein GOS9-like isoform X1 [Aegilops tauschii subsp. strangulata]
MYMHSVVATGLLGHFEEPVEGEWAILGGTGEFAYAQGVVTFKKVHLPQIRAICLSFPSSLSMSTKMGPWGGNGGSIQDITTGTPMRLQSVTLSSESSWIVSLAFTYIDKLGKRRNEGPWGPDKGNSQTIEFGPKEYVTEISGTIDNVISSLLSRQT